MFVLQFFGEKTIARLAYEFTPWAINTLPDFLVFDVSQLFRRAISGAVKPEYLWAFYTIHTASGA